MGWPPSTRPASSTAISSQTTSCGWKTAGCDLRLRPGDRRRRCPGRDGHDRDTALHGAEVLAGEPATSRSDVWAFGVVLHEIFFGRRPERKTSSFDGNAQGPIRPSSSIERAMLSLCEACLNESPAMRPEAALVGRPPVSASCLHQVREAAQTRDWLGPRRCRPVRDDGCRRPDPDRTLRAPGGPGVVGPGGGLHRGHARRMVRLRECPLQGRGTCSLLVAPQRSYGQAGLGGASACRGCRPDHRGAASFRARGRSVPIWLPADESRRSHGAICRSWPGRGLRYSTVRAGKRPRSPSDNARRRASLGRYRRVLVHRRRLACRRLLVALRIVLAPG